MKLTEEPFYKIRSKLKTIELRLNDEKRKKVKVGDFIEFTLIDSNTEKLTVQVTALYHFNSFQELFDVIPKEKMGYATNEIPDPACMEKFYSKENQEKYGALGIEFQQCFDILPDKST